MSNNSTSFIIGSTGLCGSAFLKYCFAAGPVFSKITTLTRRELPEYLLTDVENREVLKSIVDSDTSNWVNKISLPIKGANNVFFSGLGTTKADAGGLDNQYKIDHVLNVELAKTAKKLGYNTYVLVSSAGANENSRFPYFKMKGDTEREILDLKFDHTIILRPGALLGDRHGAKKDIWNKAAAMVGSWAYRTRFQRGFGYPVYGDSVGKVGVKLAIEVLKGESPSPSTSTTTTTTTTTPTVRFVESKEILELS